MNDNDIFRTPTRQEVDEIVREAYRLRHQAYADMFAALGRGLRATGRYIVLIATSFSEARQARELYENLSRMSDRELADAGISRGEISSVVAGVYRRDEETVSASAQTDRAQAPQAAPGRGLSEAA